MNNPEQKNFLIAFCDLSNFSRLSRRIDEMELFEYLTAMYRIIGEITEAANGRVVKFIGDAAFIVFEEKDTDAGILALKKIQSEIDSRNKARGFDSRLIVKAHFGKAVAGMIGTASDQRYDVFGNEVNIAATLKSNGYAISVEAFRRLSPETRKLFKKHTPPVTYIGVDERHVD